MSPYLCNLTPLPSSSVNRLPVVVLPSITKSKSFANIFPLALISPSTVKGCVGLVVPIPTYPSLSIVMA